jgi:hypothetical protein
MLIVTRPVHPVSSSQAVVEDTVHKTYVCRGTGHDANVVHRMYGDDALILILDPKGPPVEFGLLGNMQVYWSRY